MEKKEDEEKMCAYRQRKIDEYIKEYYPNAVIDEYDDPGVDLIFFDDESISDAERGWYPLCCYRDPYSGHLMYGGRKNVHHTYIEGETGAGKTTRLVMQSIRALSMTSHKPSFLITDLHGEIIENLYLHLKKNGYTVKILNCDDPSRSDTYNPFASILKDCRKNKKIDFEASDNIRRIAGIMNPIQGAKDPIWEIGARSYTNGLILDKVEDCMNGDLPDESLNFYNIIQNHYWLRNNISKFARSSSLSSIKWYAKKEMDGSTAIQKMLSVTDNADRTRDSYFGVIENYYDEYGQPSLYGLSSSNTIDIDDFLDNPTVIVIQAGSTSVGDSLTSIMVNDIYTKVVRRGKESSTKRLTRDVHCFLDEFANCNIADASEYVKMLTTSRKFGMYWHMLLQCDAQLEKKFDEFTGNIIRANCTEIFMGSQDYATQKRFAESCGSRTVESLGSIVNDQAPDIRSVALLTPEKLQLLPEGCVYIKSARHSILESYYEAFYKCPEFESAQNMDDIYPINKTNYEDTLFTPNMAPPYLGRQHFEILDYISKNNPSVFGLSNLFSDKRYENYILWLEVNHLVDLDDGFYEVVINKRLMQLLRYKYENDMLPDASQFLISKSQL